jgi:xyloglucan fucosyltransferase
MQVVWTENGIQSKATAAGNPGTEHSAVVDMLLLSQCDELLVTYESSYGWIAHGFGGLKSTIMDPGNHQDMTHVWHAKTITSEPCSWTMPSVLMAASEDATDIKGRIKQFSPFWQRHMQCHWRMN